MAKGSVKCFIRVREWSSSGRDAKLIDIAVDSISAIKPIQFSDCLGAQISLNSGENYSRIVDTNEQVLMAIQHAIRLAEKDDASGITVVNAENTEVIEIKWYNV